MFTPSYKRYALAAMTAVYTLSFVDRGLMILLLQPIKEDLQLSDTQLGFVTGIAFGLFYATVGIPIARWADRGNRVTIASLAIGLWGLTVMSCVWVTNYVQLVCARIAAAVGESGGMPPTYSLVGDYFPEPAARARAMAIYLTANSVSALVSFIVGGWLSELYGWRMAFFWMGVPALILAVVLKWTIVEPRTQVPFARAHDRKMPTMKTVLATLWYQRSCRHLSLALILLYMVAFGLSPWYAAFLMRSHGMGTAELGVWLGLTFSIGGTAGILIGGYAASRWFADNEPRQMRLSAVTIACLVPCVAAFVTLPHKHQAVGVLLPLMIVFTVFMGPSYALMQRLVADEMRATTMAVVMFLVNLIGFGVGPQVVGVLSDLMMPRLGNDSLRYAILIMSFVALWAAYHFWRVGQTVKEDLLTSSAQRLSRAEASGARSVIPSAVASSAGMEI